MEKLLTTGKKNRNKLRRMRADLPLVTDKEKQKGIFMTDELLNGAVCASQLSGSARFRRKKRSTANTAIFCTDGTVPLQNGSDPEQNRRRISKNSIRGRAGCFNREPYEDVIGERYRDLLRKPAFAVRAALVKRMEGASTCLYQELEMLLSGSMRDRLLELTAAMELYLELYAMFEGGDAAVRAVCKRGIYWYVSGLRRGRQEYQVREIVDPSLHFVKDIVMESDPERICGIPVPSTANISPKMRRVQPAF